MAEREWLGYLDLVDRSGAALEMMGCEAHSSSADCFVILDGMCLTNSQRTDHFIRSLKILQISKFVQFRPYE